MWSLFYGAEWVESKQKGSVCTEDGLYRSAHRFDRLGIVDEGIELIPEGDSRRQCWDLTLLGKGRFCRFRVVWIPDCIVCSLCRTVDEGRFVIEVKTVGGPISVHWCRCSQPIRRQNCVRKHRPKFGFSFEQNCSDLSRVIVDYLSVAHRRGA